MLKLFRYLKPYVMYVILAPLLMFVEVAIDVSLPKIISNIINVGIPLGIDGDMSYIITNGLLMIVLSVVGVFGGIGCIYFSSIASLDFGCDLRNSLFAKVQSFSFANLDMFKTSSLITRLTNDVTQVQQIVLMGLRIMVRSPLMLIGGIIMACTINLKLSLIVAVAITLLVVAIVLVILKGFPLFLTVQQKLDSVNTVMRENLSGVRVVKAFVRRDFEASKFKATSEDLMNTTVSAFRIIILIFPIMMIVMNVSIVAVLWFGAVQVDSGTILVGDIIAFIQYMTQILISLMMLAMILMMVSRSKASADRIVEVLDTDVDIISPNVPVKANLDKCNIEFKNVSFRHKGSTGDPIISNVSFTIEHGKTFAILGATGAGKSTLVNLIPRLYDVTEGEILINGINVREFDLHDLRDKVSVVLQEAVLFSGSIIDNLKWGKEDATIKEIEYATKVACAYDFIMKLDDKFETELSQKATNLSGGQKQRLSIARALLKKPSVLILDDSTSAVDMATEAKIQKALKEDFKDCTKIIIAQRISSVVNADKIIVLSGGEISAEGTHQQLLETSEIYRDIYYSQVKEEEFKNAGK